MWEETGWKMLENSGICGAKYASTTEYVYM